jgi:hypothetical protein
VRDYYEASSEGYSKLSLSKALCRYISLPIAFDQSAQLVPGAGSDINSVLQDVLYVLDLHGNLLSVSHLARCSAEVHFLGEDCHVYNRRKSLILKGGLHNNLYVMKLQVSGPVTANIAMFDSHIMDISQPPDCALTMRLTSSSTSLDLWHRCLGHLHTNAVTCMADEGLVTGMTISNREALAGPCEPCLEGKQTQEVICKVTTTCANTFSAVCTRTFAAHSPLPPTAATGISLHSLTIAPTTPPYHPCGTNWKSENCSRHSLLGQN